MEDLKKKIVKRFPHNICFVHYLVDSILDGNDGDGCFNIEGEEFAFCKDPSEKLFWKQNIITYRFLFTAAMLKYYSKIHSQLQDNYEAFVKRYYGIIANESKLFFQNFLPQHKNYDNIVDFLYTEPDFALTRQFDFDHNSTIVSERAKDIICIVKKSLSSRVDNQEKAKEEKYGSDYIYVSVVNGSYEELGYDTINDGTMHSYSMMYTSMLSFSSDYYIDIKNVISFAKTDNGYVYIVKEGNNNYLRGQGFSQISRLLRNNKQPVIVKAYGSRVVVLMSDGTLTSNFCESISGIRRVWFDDSGNIKTEKI